MAKLGLRVLGLALCAMLGSFLGAMAGNMTLAFYGLTIGLSMAVIVLIVACFRIS